MADSKVGILIEAKDNASSTIKGVKSELSGLGKSTGEVEGLSGAFASLSTAAGVAAAAFAAIEVGKQVVELAQYSAQVQRTETAFATFSQQAGLATNTIEMLRSASRGTISDFDLMQSSSRALALGVADSSQELTQLLEVAIARGKALGVSANQAFSDLVTGIGRMSPLILDNLGIITGGEKLFDAYAASIGKATSALTDQERKQALVNKVIAESTALVAANSAAGDDNASKIERAEASWQNIKATIGEIVLPNVVPFLDGIASGLDRLNASLDKTKQLSELLSAEKNAAAGGKVSNDADLYIKAAQAAGTYADTSNRLKQEQDALAATIMSQTSPALKSFALDAYQVANASAAASSGMVNTASAAANLGGSLAVLSGEFQRVIALQNAFAGQQAGLASIAGQVIGAAGQEEGLKFLRQSTVALSEQQQAWQDAGYSVAEVNALSIAYNDSLRKTTETTYGYGAAAVKVNRAAAAAVKAVNAEYEDLKGKVSGVLSGALSDVAGVDVDSILPRQDSVSEDARRLADVAVNGFASPWADYLSNKFPDTIGAAFSSGGDIKQTAAQLLKDFQDGLRPELLDKEKAKELVRRAIVGEKNLKSLTDEIAKELAGELGVSVAQAQAAAVQALGGGGATGGASGVTTPKQVPIVPTIDTSKLPTTPISVKGEISSVTVSSSLTAYTLSIKSEITSVTIADTVTNPQIASTAAIGELVIAEGAKVPTPVITGGLSIDVVSVRSDAEVPTVTLPATVTTVTLGDNVTNPQIASTAAIGSIVIAEGVTPPVPVLTGGLYIDAVALRSDVVLPTVTLGATITAYSISSSATTEKPLALSARVTPFIDTASITDEQFVSAATFITESMPVLVTPQITVTGIDTSTALTYLESELAPIVTPYINYLGIPPEDLQAGGLVIGDGLKLGIVASNIGGAIVTEINKAQELIRSSGKTSGTNWGAGFLETVGQNVPSALVNLLVTLVTPGVLESIGNAGTKTGAQN